MDTNKLAVTRDVTDYYMVVGVTTNATVWGWVTNGILRSVAGVATVTLTVDQWHGVVNDISTIIDGMGDDIDDNMARLFNVRDAIELALRYDVRNG